MIKFQIRSLISTVFAKAQKKDKYGFWYILTLYDEDFTHGFDTQNYPKLQASLGTQPENTHGIQRQTQPNPYPWIFSGRVG